MGGIVRQARHAVDPMFGTSVKPSSTVSNPNGPAQLADPVEMAAAEAAQRQQWQQQEAARQAANKQRAQGYLASMTAPQGRDLSGSMSNHIEAAPPAQWGYQPGKGPVWQTPERTINGQGDNAVSMNWKLNPSKPGSPYGGNRF